MRGHNGVPEVNPTFFTPLQIPYEWKPLIYHTGSLNNCRSLVQGGLIAGGTSDRKGRQAWFFSAMPPLDNSLPEASNVSTSVHKMVPYKHAKRPDLDAVYTFDFKIAQDGGLKILSSGQHCDCSVWHLADRSMCKSAEIQQKQFGDRNSLR